VVVVLFDIAAVVDPNDHVINSNDYEYFHQFLGNIGELGSCGSDQAKQAQEPIELGLQPVTAIIVV
jgi:hypothetical protein